MRGWTPCAVRNFVSGEFQDPSNVKHWPLVWRELNLMRSACARRVCFWTCTQKHSQNRNVGFVCFTPATRLHFGLPGVMNLLMSMLYFHAVDSRVCLRFRVPPPRLVDGIKKLRIRFLCLRPESTGDVALDSVPPKRCFRSKTAPCTQPANPSDGMYLVQASAGFAVPESSSPKPSLLSCVNHLLSGSHWDCC